MNGPRIGEPNLGALVGAVVGSCGGLFAVGTIPAILSHNPSVLLATPVLNLVSWFLCGVLGWFLGGQIGPRLESSLGERNGNVLGGTIGGIMPVISVAMWSWYMVTH